MTSRYVYAVVPAGVEAPPDLTSVGGPIEVAAYGDLAAIVCGYDGDWVPASRRNIRAHADVVEAAMAGGPIVPMRFGVLVPDDDALHEFLADNQRELSALLDELDGKVELRLHARYEDDVPIKEAATGDRQIRRLRDRVNRLPEGASYYERIRLGEAVAAGAERVRLRDEAAIVERLAPHVERYDATGGDGGIRLAFLIHRDRRRAFERAVDRLAAEHAGRLRFELIGPLPAWDFVDLALEVR